MTTPPMTTLRLAARNVNRQKKRSFLLGGAVAFGVTIITLINGFTEGFVGNVRENVAFLFAGHLFVEGYEKTPSGRLVHLLRDDPALQRVVADAELSARSITRRSEVDAALIFAGGSIRQQIVGIQWDAADYLRDRLALRAGSMERLRADRNALVLHESVAEQLGATVGDTLLVQARTASGQHNLGELVLTAVSVDTGVFSGISAYAHRSWVNELLNIAPDAYTTLGILLDDIGSVDAESERLHAAMADALHVVPRYEGTGAYGSVRRDLLQSTWMGTRYYLSTINDTLADINDVAQTVTIAGGAVALILFFIVAIGITNTYRVVVRERVREIGTMRALGLHRRQARSLFLTEALLLAVGGGAAGLVLAAVARAILQAIDWGNQTLLFIFMDEGHLSFPFNPLLLAGYLLGVAAITLIAALAPANRAARQDPAGALRSV